MKIVVDESGNKYKVEIEHLTPHSDKSVKATVLKSMRTEQGARDYVKMMSSKYPGAIVVKSLEGYDTCMNLDGLPPLPAPVHVVMEEDMSPVVETVSVKNADEMFRAMYKQGLLHTSAGIVSPTEKFYSLLTQFTEQAMNSYMKAVNPEADKTDAGVPMLDVITEAFGVLKAADKLALSQEEADNKEGDSRTESLGDQKGAAEEEVDKRPDATGATPEKQALSQEESDNKSGDARTVAISDAEVKQKMGDVQVMKASDANIFKSLGEVKAFIKKNPDHYVDSPTLDETDTFGKRYKFVARPFAKKEYTGFGNRKPRN